jgi:hypothetical protein
MPPENEEVTLWFKRIKAATDVLEKWEKDYRVAENYQYWLGNQRDNPFDGSERKAQHNKIHPRVSEDIPSLYYYNPIGRVVALPARSDTPGETVSEKARLLADTGVFLTRDKTTGFRENTFNALKESRWALGCVEVGYDPDFIDNPSAPRPPLKEKETTKIVEEQEPEGDTFLEAEGEILGEPVRDELGLTVDEESDLPSLEAELRRVQEMLRGETFFVKHILCKQILISPSNKAVLENNDWVGYWEDYSLEDVKRSPAYENTADLKAQTEQEGKLEDGSIDKVRLFRIWDLRTKTKIVLAKGHHSVLMKRPFKRCPLKFLRMDIDPYHFRPLPPIYFQLPSQDQYNDSAEYMRKMRISTVPRYSYDEDAVNADEAAKFQSRDMNIMIPRKAGTHSVIEPVAQPSTAAAAVQTLALSEKEFSESNSASGNPLDPATQTATRAIMANTAKSAEVGFDRTLVADWLATIIEELILLAVDHMSLPRWIAINVDLDSPLALEESIRVAKVYEQIDAEKLRDAVAGINWHIEVETDTLSPVAESERGMKLMQVVTFISNPPAAALLSQAPNLLKRLLSLGGIKTGEDVDAIKEALAAVVRMNMLTAGQGVSTPGISPQAGQEAGPVTAPPQPPGPPPGPPGIVGV